MANKEDRPNPDEKALHTDFDFIPNFEHRTIIMVFDSDANERKKKSDFNRCSKAFENCLYDAGINHYEKIILPSNGKIKVGLDDYLLIERVDAFHRLVNEQSNFANGPLNIEAH